MSELRSRRLRPLRRRRIRREGSRVAAGRVRSGLTDPSALPAASSALTTALSALRVGRLTLCLAALLATAPAFAVTHDDIAAMSHTPQAIAPTQAPPADSAPIGTQPFTNRRNPPSYRTLSDAEFARYDLGMAVFNTRFVPAGTPNAGRRAGVGPLFNSSSCDSCHNNGARGRGPTEDGPAPSPLVMQLATMPTKSPTDPEGDPVYGRVLNTISLDGVPPEGVAMIRYEEISGHYPDGSAWSLRAPHYNLTNLRYGPLSPQTIIKPRLAPALFGAGLLDAASVDRDPSATSSGATAPGAGSTKHAPQDLPAHGRFGWQASALSVRDQTARAFAREMGLTSADMRSDDCTKAETACQQQPSGGSPEVSDDIFNAILSFQRWLAVPASPTPHPIPDRDANTFTRLGCVGCHQPQLQVALTDDAGKNVPAVIAPYTDLRLHDLGARLADETVGGKKVTSKWRTAPLWGLGYRMSLERFPTFLHDGRARSAEEAILWHDGEAAAARTHFEQLTAPERKVFLHWLETL
ncbi:MAG: hypothetical protein JWL65_5297 [Gammaproteobacteria bacterium]|nr:hypothetical protein [Gammaproteobacteria bacterium]